MKTVLINRMRKFWTEYKNPRFRESRAFYASEIEADARDIYWRITGEKPTNPTDVLGHTKMLFGSAIEYGIVTNVLNNLHIFGLHQMPTRGQIPVGGTNPNIDGYLDGLVVETIDGKAAEKYVLEIKCKNGYGANLFNYSWDPGTKYMSQLAYYLHETSRKGITNKGLFLFCLNSDKCIGEWVEIQCEYNPETTVMTAVAGASLLTGKSRNLSITYELGPALKRLEKIKEYAAKGELPPADKQYKYPVTPETVMGWKDAQLLDAMQGRKVIGDWEIAYSHYKNKHVELAGGVGYTEHERKVLATEYLTRVPGSTAARKILNK